MQCGAAGSHAQFQREATDDVVHSGPTLQNKKQACGTKLELSEDTTSFGGDLQETETNHNL